jgi:hypothetical protein
MLTAVLGWRSLEYHQLMLYRFIIDVLVLGYLGPEAFNYSL